MQLRYRGATYEKQIHKLQPQLVEEVNALTVTLRYRGQTYQRQLSVPRVYQ